MDFSNDQLITLTEFIREEERKHIDATGEFTAILSSIALGTKIVSRAVNRAGLEALIGKTGQTNIQGEEVQQLDIFADSIFSKILDRSGHFLSMVSEEQECLIPAIRSQLDARYVIAFDPLDGSSNIDVNISIGSIWGIYRNHIWADEANERDYMQPGKAQVAAGYSIYGSSTMFVFTTGNGVHGFTLDPDTGEFFLTHPSLKMPAKGAIYSCNEGNFQRWNSNVQDFIKYVKAGDETKGIKPYSHRYVGSLVADFHRTLLKGGIFLYPADTTNKDGKLRLLYECAPLAFVAEQAGGAATNGTKPILELTPSKIHQRTPFFIGSKENIKLFESFVGKVK